MKGKVLKITNKTIVVHDKGAKTLKFTLVATTFGLKENMLSHWHLIN